MRKTITVVVLLCLVAAASTACAQKGRNNHVEKVTGTGADQNAFVAHQKALANAKQRALSQAGIPEDVKSFTYTYITSGSATARHTDNEPDIAEAVQFGQIMREGCLKNVVETVLNASVNPSNDMVTYNLCISADVMLDGMGKDTYLDVSGLQKSYKGNEKITFRVKPHEDCRLRVFWFSPDSDAGNQGNRQGQMIYPSPLYNDEVFKKDSVYEFPRLPENFWNEKMNDVEKERYTIKATKGNNAVETFVLVIIAVRDKPRDKRNLYVAGNYNRAWQTPLENVNIDGLKPAEKVKYAHEHSEKCCYESIVDYWSGLKPDYRDLQFIPIVVVDK